MHTPLLECEVFKWMMPIDIRLFGGGETNSKTHLRHPTDTAWLSHAPTHTPGHADLYRAACDVEVFIALRPHIAHRSACIGEFSTNCLAVLSVQRLEWASKLLLVRELSYCAKLVKHVRAPRRVYSSRWTSLKARGWRFFWGRELVHRQQSKQGLQWSTPKTPR